MPDEQDDGLTEQEIIELAEGQQFKVPGQDEPVSVDDFGERFIPRSDYTKQRQQEKQQLERERERIQSREKELQQAQELIVQRAQAIAQAQQQANGSQQGQNLSQLQQQLQQHEQQYGGYLTSNFGRTLEQELASKEQQFQQALAQRDQQIQMLAQTLQQQNQQLQGLASHTASTTEEQYLAQLADEFEGQMPEDMIKTFWSAYEFDDDEDWRQGFREILGENAKRWQEYQSEHREKAARQQERDVRMPSMGGQASPSGGIDESVQDMDHEEIAGMVFDQFNEGAA